MNTTHHVFTKTALSVELASGAHEALTWRALIEARIHGLPGVSTRELGERVAPELALPAEQSNAAARHIYALRKRQRSASGSAPQAAALRKRQRSAEALITVDHHYALADELQVGWVVPRPRDPAL